MKNNLIILMLLGSAMFHFSDAYAQTEATPEKINKNSLQISIGGFPFAFENQLSFMYERTLHINERRSFALSAQILYASPVGLNDHYYSARIGGRIGKKLVKIEIAAGWYRNTYISGDIKYPYDSFAPIIAVRLQKYNKPFLFRIGAGMPEGFFIGVGLHF